MDHNDREQFWKTLCSLPGNDIVAEREQLFKSIKYPKLLFRYRPVSTKSLEALRTNKLYFSSANYYDDPFDTFLHIDIEAIRKEYLSAFQTPESTEAVVDGVKSLLGNILSEEQAAQFTVENVTNALSHGLTIASQLHIIGDDTEHLIANAWNSQWDCVLLGALFNHNAMCNLQSDQPIEQIAKAEYIHITNYELRALLSDIYNISEEDELWLEKYYKTAYKLLEKDSFQTAVHTMASYRWHSVPRVQLAVIWSGIESLFNVNTEVSFRISLYIANFLGENEAQAQQIFKQVRKIYSSRSSAVHGNKTKDNLESAVEESANLLTRILRRCAELNKLPDVDNLAFRVDKQKQGIKCKILVP